MPPNTRSSLLQNISRGAPLWILLAAYALRLYGLDSVRHNHDFAIPHSLGIGIIESLTRGAFSELPVLSLPSGVRIFNPVGASYLWAVVSVFARNPYVATAVSVMLGTLAVAMVYDLARRLYGRWPALVAMACAAASPWGIFTARGTWLQGQLEFAAIAAAWGLFIALRRASPRRIVFALAFSAVMMQTYLMALALSAQVAVACMAALAAGRRVLRPALLGISVCVLSGALFLGILAMRGAATVPLGATLNNSVAPYESIDNPFGLHLTPAALRGTLQVVSGLGHEDSQMISPALLLLANEWRGLIVEILVGIGALCAAWDWLRRRRRLDHALVLIWFGLPMTLAFLISIPFANLYVGRHYMLISAPAGYLLAGLGARWLAARRAGRALLGIVCALTIAVSAQVMAAHVADVAARPFDTRLDNYALRVQQRWSAFWRAQCAEVLNPQLKYWTASAYQTAEHVRAAAAQIGVSSASDVWEIPPGGGACVTRLADEPAPRWADAYAIDADAGTRVITYRSRPISNISARSLGDPAFAPLPLNIGWTLLAIDSAPTGQAGQSMTLTQVWRIDQLPAEPHDDWVYPVFVHLVKPDGGRQVLVENAPSIDGRLWRAGDYVISTARFSLPADLIPGAYALEVSLFDPGQRKNAAYFGPAGEVIVTLRRPLQVR